jgi:N-acetyl-alpha-D-muramate 1-phosphate uridylyltransferase
MRGMILAAGRGERMRPLTDSCPKPLLEVAGRSLIEHQIDRLLAAGITEIVINLSWLGGLLRKHLGDGSRFGVRISYSEEPEGALESGGGIREALPLLGDAPFLVVNADLWCDFDLGSLVLADGDLAALVLVDNPAHHPDGDFDLLDGRVLDQPRLTFAGIGLYRPTLLAAHPRGRFGIASVLRDAMRLDRVSGMHHRGAWDDVGTPERLESLRVRVMGSQAE